MLSPYFIMSYSFDTLYQEYASRKSQSGVKPSVDAFIDYTMADVCLHLDNDMPLSDKLQYLFDYIEENYPA